MVVFLVGQIRSVLVDARKSSAAVPELLLSAAGRGFVVAGVLVVGAAATVALVAALAVWPAGGYYAQYLANFNHVGVGYPCAVPLHQIAPVKVVGTRNAAYGVALLHGVVARFASKFSPSKGSRVNIAGSGRTA